MTSVEKTGFGSFMFDLCYLNDVPSKSHLTVPILFYKESVLTEFAALEMDGVSWGGCYGCNVRYITIKNEKSYKTYEMLGLSLELLKQHDIEVFIC